MGSITTHAPPLSSPPKVTLCVVLYEVRGGTREVRQAVSRMIMKRDSPGGMYTNTGCLYVRRESTIIAPNFSTSPYMSLVPPDGAEKKRRDQKSCRKSENEEGRVKRCW